MYHGVTYRASIEQKYPSNSNLYNLYIYIRYIVELVIQYDN